MSAARQYPCGCLLLWFVVAVLLAVIASAQTFTGPARVIDGDSLEIQGQRMCKGVR